MKRILEFAFAIGIAPALFGQSTTNAPIYKITTVAGQGNIGDADPTVPGSGRGTGGLLLQPDAVAFDSAGNLFIADSVNHRVRRVDAVTGAITTIAGTGNPGFDASSEGKPAVNARLSTPAGLAFDPAGNLYITDKGNHRIRKIDANGIITTYAGEAPISGNATTGGTTNGYAGDNRKAILAHLNSPNGIAFDQFGNLFIADTSNNRIRRVDPSGIITTYAGNGISGWAGDGGLAINARLNAPEGVLVDVNQNVFIADTQNHRIRLVTPGGVISTIAGTCLPLFTRNPVTGQNVPVVCTTGTAGFASTTNFAGVTGGDLSPATSSTLNAPRGLALDANGNLYVADQTNNRVRAINTGGIITTVAGGGSSASDGVQAFRASLNGPRSVTIDPNGRLVFADSLNGKVRAIDPVTGTIQTLAGQTSFSGDGGPATASRLNNPRGVAVDGAGNVYISDTGNNRIRKVTGGVITSIAGNGTAGFSGDVSPSLLIAPASSAQINAPNCLAVSPGGLIYFADKGNNRVRRIDLDGTISTIAGRARTANEGLIGAPTFSGDGGPGTLAQLNSPTCVALDPNLGNVVVADTSNHAVRLITVSTGIITTVAGNGTSGSSGDGDQAGFSLLNAPQGVAVDPSGNIFIADTGNHLLREVLTSGVMQTVAGISGSSGSDGDDADTLTGKFNSRIDPPAIGSRLSGPQGVATDSAGNIYIADTGNNRIRRINAAQTYIHSIAGNSGTAAFALENVLGNTSIVYQPAAIATDAAGNVYFTDRLGTIRQLTPNVPPAQQGNPVVQ